MSENKQSLHYFRLSALYDVRIVEYAVVPPVCNMLATASVVADGTVEVNEVANMLATASMRPYAVGTFYPIAAPSVISATYVIDPSKANSNIGPLYSRYQNRYYAALYDTTNDAVVLHYADDREGTWTALTGTTMPLEDGRYCVVMGEAEHEQKIWVIVQELKDTPASKSPVKLWEYDGSTDTFTQTALVVDSVTDSITACVSAALRKNDTSSDWEIVIAYNGEREFYISEDKDRVHAAIYNVETSTVTATQIVLDDSAFSPVYHWQHPSIVSDPDYTDTYVFFMTGPEETVPQDVSGGIWGRTLYNDNSLQDWPFIAAFNLTGIAPGFGFNEFLPPMGNAISWRDGTTDHASVGIMVLETYFAAFTAEADGTNQIFVNGTGDLIDYVTPVSGEDPNDQPGNYGLYVHPQLSTEFDYPSNANARIKRYALFTPPGSVIRDRSVTDGQFVGDAYNHQSETIGQGISGAITKNQDQFLMSYMYNDDGSVMYDEFGLTTQGYIQFWLADPHSSIKLNATLDLDGSRQLASRTVTAAGVASASNWGGTHIEYDPVQLAVSTATAAATVNALPSCVVSAKVDASGSAQLSALGGFDVGAPMVAAASSAATFGGNNLTSVDGVGTVEVIVVRGTGDSPGEDIVDGLLTEDIVALSRGRMELDAAQSNQNVTLTIVYKTGVRQGQLVEVYDRLVGASWRGKIVGIQHTMERITGPRATSQLEVERVTEFYS